MNPKQIIFTPPGKSNTKNAQKPTVSFDFTFRSSPRLIHLFTAIAQTGSCQTESVQKSLNRIQQITPNEAEELQTLLKQANTTNGHCGKSPNRRINSVHNATVIARDLLLLPRSTQAAESTVVHDPRQGIISHAAPTPTETTEIISTLVTKLIRALQKMQTELEHNLTIEYNYKKLSKLVDDATKLIKQLKGLSDRLPTDNDARKSFETIDRNIKEPLSIARIAMRYLRAAAMSERLAAGSTFRTETRKKLRIEYVTTLALLTKNGKPQDKDVLNPTEILSLKPLIEKWITEEDQLASKLPANVEKIDLVELLTHFREGVAEEQVNIRAIINQLTKYGYTEASTIMNYLRGYEQNAQDLNAYVSKVLPNPQAANLTEILAIIQRPNRTSVILSPDDLKRN